MKSFLAPTRTDKNRRRPFRAEDIHTQVGVRDVHHAPRAQLVLSESLAVRAQGSVVIYAGGHVTEMRGRERFAGDGLEIENAQSFFRIAREQGVLGMEKGKGCSEGTSGEELQELAAL